MDSACRIQVAAALLALAATGSPARLAGQATGEIGLSGFGGVTTDPGGFDVFRQTEFDVGYHAGVSLAFWMSPNLAVRGDLSRAWSSGREVGVLDEAVDFDRTYYGVAIVARFPLASVSPYLLAGGGMVSVDRRAPSRNYAFSELAGRVGVGVAYALPGTAFEAFVEGSEWFYSRVSTGKGTQLDTAVSAGLTFIPDL